MKASVLKQVNTGWMFALLKTVGCFYSRRKEFTFTGDMARNDYRNKQFILYDFRDRELIDADFSDTTLFCCDFRGANLQRAVFANATVITCDFREACLTGADFRVRSERTCSFHGANIDGVLWPPDPDSIGDTDCRYNAHSPFLRCAVHPLGQCDVCPDFESV